MVRQTNSKIVVRSIEERKTWVNASNFGRRSIGGTSSKFDAIVVCGNQRWPSPVREVYRQPKVVTVIPEFLRGMHFNTKLVVDVAISCICSSIDDTRSLCSR